MRICLKRKFDAAHFLGQKQYSESLNASTYGKCRNMHGHTWTVEVEGEGPVSDTGMVVNFNEIKEIIDTFDHGVVNNIVGLPTAENLVSWILGKVREIGVLTSIRVRVYESENAWAEDEWRTQ